MKKILVILVLFMLTVGAALSEANPDGTVYSVYKADYDKDALIGFERMMYLEPSGLLLSAYSDDMEITVTIEEAASAKDAAGFMAHYLSGVKGYAKVIKADDIQSWNAPVEGEGGRMRFTYMYKNASETDEVYVTDVYAAPVNGGMFLVIVFNSWVGEAGTLLNEMEEAFFSAFTLEKVNVSTQFMAQVKNAYLNEEEKTMVVLDFCQVEYDASIFTIYAVNDEPEEKEYVLRKDALIWSPKANTALYAMKETDSTHEAILESAQAYYQKHNFDIIYQVLFDENNEIIWMMHYNAF